MSKRERLRRDHRTQDQADLAQWVWEACGWSGSVLPAVQLAGGSAWPAVRWDLPTTEDRLRTRMGPVLDRVRIRDWLRHRWPVPAPLTVEGLVFLAERRRSVAAMVTLAPFGQMVWWQPQPNDWDLWTCQLRGLWLVDESMSVRSRGRDAVPELGFESLEARLLVEQVFHLAIETDRVPLEANSDRECGDE